MKMECEWELGSEMFGKEIYLSLKEGHSKKFSHFFIPIDEAEDLAKDILSATEKMKQLSTGKCVQCNDYITNEEIYYEVKNKKMVHKKCIGDYLEKHNITEKLMPIISEKFDTHNIRYEHLNK